MVKLQHLFYGNLCQITWASLVVHGKKSACNTGDTDLILGQKDPLEEVIATHSSIPAWRIPWTEEPGGQQSMRSQRIGQN